MSGNADLQHTLEKSATLEGTALHTGGTVALTLHPASTEHGIRFKRTDLADEPTIDAKLENVKMVERATTLAEGNVKVHTVEHVLAALSAMGVDNALLEMNSNEPPIGDGSASPYVELIQKAGVSVQDAPRRYFEVMEPIHLETKNGSLLTVVPDRKFRVSCTQIGPEGRFTQFYSTEITPAIFAKEIAPARTFVFYEDVKPLMDKGLIKGGSLQNALVIRDEAVLSQEALRFEDEFVRHKVLDVIGDLSLFGPRIKGHVIAVRPGHAANTDLARILGKHYDRLMSMIPTQKVPEGKAVLDTKDLLRILPHRHPFLMVDRIVAFEGETKCTGVKTVSANEPYFQGHFPGHPVMPGVLQVEAMAQVASVIVIRRLEREGQIGYFMSADKVKFRKPVFPGDTLFIHVDMVSMKKNIGKAVCQCVVNNEIVSEGTLMFGLVT